MACSKRSIDSSEHTHTKAGAFQERQRFTGQALLRAHRSTTPPEMSGVGPWAGGAGPRGFADTPVHSFVQHPLRHARASWEEARTQTTTPWDTHTTSQRHASPLSTPRALQAARWHHLSGTFHTPREAASVSRSSRWRFQRGQLPGLNEGTRTGRRAQVSAPHRTGGPLSPCFLPSHRRAPQCPGPRKFTGRRTSEASRVGWAGLGWAITINCETRPGKLCEERRNNH